MQLSMLCTHEKKSRNPVVTRAGSLNHVQPSNGTSRLRTRLLFVDGHTEQHTTTTPRPVGQEHN